MTAWVGGATALVVALGGLATATKDLWHRQPAADDGELRCSRDTRHARHERLGRANEEPTAYSVPNHGSTLRWVTGMWVWTDKDGNKYRYTDKGADGANSIAVLQAGGEKGEDVWLRWPTAGGGQASEATTIGNLDGLGRS